MANLVYKIWSADRTTKAAVVAKDWHEFQDKIKEKFHMRVVDRLVLEEDGTEVDEEYLPYVEQNTVLLVMRPGETYQTAASQGFLKQHTKDAPDGQSSDTHRHVADLLALLKQDITLVSCLSKSELQAVVDMKEMDVTDGGDDDDTTTDAIQDVCQRRLDELDRYADAVALLKLVKQGLSE